MMIDVLRRTVQEVSEANDLQTALNIIVVRLNDTLKADICTVYLVDKPRQRLTLCANRGFKLGTQQIELPINKGLVGRVVQRAEVINIDNAPSRSSYLSILGIDDAHLQGYLGVPITQHRDVLGVIVVQHRQARRFNTDEEGLVVTLAAQLAGAISHAKAANLDTVDQQQTLTYQGIAGAPGVVIGQAVVVYPPARLASVPDHQCDDPEQEEQAFLVAVDQLRAEIRSLDARLKGHVPDAERAIFQAFETMLNGDTLITDTIERIHEGQWAPGALRATVDDHAQQFAAMNDAYLAERADDVRDLGRRILMYLQAHQPAQRDFPPGTVLVGEDISAMQLAEVPPENLAAIVSNHGTGYSHVAILARAMGIPAVNGCTDLPVTRVDGRELIIDGYSGKVLLQPSASVKTQYQNLADEEQVLSQQLRQLRDQPSVTADGHAIPLHANTGLLADVSRSLIENPAGIGLYRTEFPFLVREHFPTEKEQIAIYRKALNAFAPRPVVLRTLDAGGDKLLPYYQFKEENPFLGYRGIRLTLDHHDIFIAQLKAMLSADIGLGNLRILFPMITSVDEVDEAQEVLQQAYDELREDELAVTMPPVGIMIEVPSTLYLLDALAQRSDFFSIGTNDLTQYLLAVDRGNERVAGLYDQLHPAVIHAIQTTIEAGKVHNKPVSVCGELADDPAGALLLLGLGIDTLSMTAGSLQRIKWVFSRFTLSEAQVLAKQALTLESTTQIRELLNDALFNKDLGGLIRAGMH